MVHKDGGNLLQEGSAREGVQRLFQAFDLVRNVEGYDELCYKQEHAVWDQGRGNYSCPLHSITTFWNQSSAVFQDEIDTDEETVEALSALYYPSGKKVDRKTIMGHVTQVSPDNALLVSAKSYVTIFQLTPIDDESEPVEKRMIDELLDLKEQWAAEGTPFQVELDAERSFSDEFNRAITKDLPLIPIVFVIMSVMCILIFSRRDRVQSRGAVGLGATVTVLLSMMASYGLLFVCGVPFSFLTQILPFIMFGIGLDNAFIIHGAYERTDPTEEAPERVAKTIQDIGGTITITTFTTALAFGLGCSSSIPAIFWLCCYAFPTVMIDYLYQLTFFIAVLSLDEQRVKAKRKDWCCCCPTSHSVDSEESTSETPTTSDVQPHIADKIMACYGNMLMKTWVKILVVIGFAGLLGGCIYSASLLEQSFEFIDLVPEDSYIIPFWYAYEDYYERTFVRPAVYFRYVDQSDYTIQEEMEGFVNALVDELEEISDQPAYFWLRDFAIFNESEAVRDLPFNEQLKAFLNDPVYGPLYVEDMVIDPTNGNLAASRTFLEMDGVDLDIVQQQVTALENQKRVTKEQPINQANDPWPFFNFDGVYRIWEFVSMTVKQSS
jgi:Niemann-Pick C1 protein